MGFRPTALGWIDTSVSTSPVWDRAQVQRLAKHLGFFVLWEEPSLVPLADHVRDSDVDALIVPSPEHLDPLTLNAVLHVADIETVCPRMSFARWRVNV
ncbi:hypothetical protein [Nocardia sp. BMG51109]|uniref:hypothetical protein n=1 Tax=Nocardia sp. BMG51109 TaxID=1056816 RepID=UPI0004677D62|nr:hypothetical protein [Nocardia sp. BMG51109]